MRGLVISAERKIAESRSGNFCLPKHCTHERMHAMSKYYPIEETFTVGATIGLWTIIGPPEFVKAGARTSKVWPCRCQCGRTKQVRRKGLAGGGNYGCGNCNSRYILRGIWKGMIYRCYNPSIRVFYRYGGRGISVCDEWRGSFTAFAQYVGERPGPKYQLDRINNDGNYEPGNVRWATPKQNCRNSSKVKNMLVNGRYMSVAELAETLGIHANTVRTRLRLGWSLDDVLRVGAAKVVGVATRKFSQEQVNAIRKQLADGIKDAEIARGIGCSQNTIGRIKRGLTYTKTATGKRVIGGGEN